MYSKRNESMVKKSVVVFILVVLGMVYSQAVLAQMTRAEAVDILISQVIDPSPNKDDLMAFGPQNMLATGVVVRPHRVGMPTYPGQPRTIETPTWFFFIDDELLDRYTHQTRFVYIDANHPNPTVGDGITVIVQGWWPVINEQSHYAPPSSPENPDWVFGDAPGNPKKKR